MKDVTVTLTLNDIKPEDHPDFIGGWVWTKLEMRWIEERIAEAVATEREACAKVIEEAPCECCWPEGSMPITEDLAAAIRARSNT